MQLEGPARKAKLSWSLSQLGFLATKPPPGAQGGCRPNKLNAVRRLFCVAQWRNTGAAHCQVPARNAKLSCRLSHAGFRGKKPAARSLGRFRPPKSNPPPRPLYITKGEPTVHPGRLHGAVCPKAGQDVEESRGGKGFALSYDVLFGIENPRELYF